MRVYISIYIPERFVCVCVQIKILHISTYIRVCSLCEFVCTHVLIDVPAFCVYAVWVWVEIYMHTYTFANMHTRTYVYIPSPYDYFLALTKILFDRQCPHAIFAPSPNSSPTACSLSTDRYTSEGEQAIEGNFGAGRTEGKEILETQIKRRAGRMGGGSTGARGKGRGTGPPHTAFFWLLSAS